MWELASLCNLACTYACGNVQVRQGHCCQSLLLCFTSALQSWGAVRKRLPGAFTLRYVESMLGRGLLLSTDRLAHHNSFVTACEFGLSKRCRKMSLATSRVTSFACSLLPTHNSKITRRSIAYDRIFGSSWLILISEAIADHASGIKERNHPIIPLKAQATIPHTSLAGALGLAATTRKGCCTM